MKTKLEILNFVGSVCSIAALLITVFTDMNWLKIFFIIVSVTAALCADGALITLAIWFFKKLPAFQNIFVKIYTIILGSMLAVVIAAFVFYWFFSALDMISQLLSTLFHSVISYN